MKKLRLLILCLLSIFCLNSCLTLGIAAQSYISEHQLFQPNPKYFYDDIKMSLNKRVRVEIEGTNKKIYIPEGYELVKYNKFKQKNDEDFPNIFIGSKNVTLEVPEYVLYNQSKKTAVLLGIRRNYKIEDIIKNKNDLIKLKENTYLVKAKKGYGNLFLKQIDKQILVYSVSSNWQGTTEEYNNEKLNFYLELTKDW